MSARPSAPAARPHPGLHIGGQRRDVLLGELLQQVRRERQQLLGLGDAREPLLGRESGETILQGRGLDDPPPHLVQALKLRWIHGAFLHRAEVSIPPFGGSRRQRRLRGEQRDEVIAHARCHGRQVDQHDRKDPSIESRLARPLRPLPQAQIREVPIQGCVAFGHHEHQGEVGAQRHVGIGKTVVLVRIGTKPNLAKVTLARKIAAITLAMWKHKEVYDPAKYAKSS